MPTSDLWGNKLVIGDPVFEVSVHGDTLNEEILSELKIVLEGAPVDYVSSRTGVSGQQYFVVRPVRGHFDLAQTEVNKALRKFASDHPELKLAVYHEADL